MNGGASRVASGSPILIVASATGDAGAIKEFELKLSDPTGEAITATERPELTQTLTFDELETTRRVWVVDPVASAALRPGKYTMRVSQGERRSPAVEFTVGSGHRPGSAGAGPMGTDGRADGPGA